MFTYCPPKVLPNLTSETLPTGKRHYVLPNGAKVPSITTILGAMKEDAIQKWRKDVGAEAANRISKHASSRGTNVHTLCERYLNNDPIGPSMPDAKEMFNSIKPYLNKINNIHYQEQALWSEKIGIAGRVDRIAEYEGELSVIDFKTSKRIKKRDDILDYFWQTTAYACFYEELVGNPIHNLVIIMAVDNEEPIIFKEKTVNHIEGLVNAIDFYRNRYGKF